MEAITDPNKKQTAMEGVIHKLELELGKERALRSALDETLKRLDVAINNGIKSRDAIEYRVNALEEERFRVVQLW